MSADSVRFEAQGVTGSACLFFQGDAQVAAAAIDDGLGCVGGSLIRVRTKPVVGGVAIHPGGTDAAVSTQGAIGASGGRRFYQAVYRNAVPSFCPPSTTHRTNGSIVAWAP